MIHFGEVWNKPGSSSEDQRAPALARGIFSLYNDFPPTTHEHCWLSIVTHSETTEIYRHWTNPIRVWLDWFGISLKDLLHPLWWSVFSYFGWYWFGRGKMGTRCASIELLYCLNGVDVLLPPAAVNNLPACLHCGSSGDHFASRPWLHLQTTPATPL